MANRVDICLGTATKGHGPSSGFNDNKKTAYRIRVHFEDQRAVIPIQFARRRDAEQGLKALRKLMSFEGTYEEVRARIIDIGPKRIRQAVCEAMAW